MSILDKNTVTNLEANEFELPIGYVDRDGKLHKTFKLREMTGEVDEAIADKKVRNNAGKIVTELIHGVVESIGTLPRIDRNIIRALTNTDRDFIVLMNHQYSLDEEVKYTEACPACGDRFEVEVRIDRIPVKYMTEDEPRKIVVELPHGFQDEEGNRYKEVTLSFPTGMLQEKIFSTFEKNPQQAITQMLAMCTESVKGYDSYRYDDFTKLTKKDRKVLSDALGELKVGVELNADVDCAECGHNFKSPIPLMTLLGE